MKSIAIVTARGGSKRIPKKNIKDFYGKPIIAYSIQAAIDSEIFDEIMVSTDSEEIAEIAKKYGASIPFYRSKKTSDDMATTSDVLKEVLGEYKKRNQNFDYMCCIYPTAPFITGDKLKNAMDLMKEYQPLEIMPVVEYTCPPQRALTKNTQNYLEYEYKEYRKTRTQDLKPLYHDAGQFYMYDIKKYLEIDGDIKDGIMPLIVSQLEVQDIDNEDDWKIAELKYQIMMGELKI